MCGRERVKVVIKVGLVYEVYPNRNPNTSPNPKPKTNPNLLNLRQRAMYVDDGLGRQLCGHLLFGAAEQKRQHLGKVKG